ncbi:hypothetical protein DL765_007880 [Monosporascus sp. GIB2]|nr:hypothetical protein DL765_007880 [Monosporascus sp. GIB2]
MLGSFLDEIPQQLSTRLIVNFILPIAAIALIRSLGSKILLHYRLRQLPLINGLGPFESSQKAKQNFLFNAQGLLEDGFKKSTKAFRVETDNAEVVVLSPDCANEIRNDNRFSFTHLLAKVEWHALNVKATILEVVARLSSRVFLGSELCRNPAWLRITVDYTVNVFFGVTALKKWPKYLHPIVWRFVPEVRKVRDQIEEAVRLIQPVVDKRIAEGKSPTSKATYSDAIQWANELANGRPYDPALLQLGFSLAAIHTTTDHLSQVLYDLCAYPEYIEPLREELVTVLKEEGMTKAGLFKLKLMDSFLKESQRFKPGALLMMRRMVLEDVTLSNGVFLPRGTQIGIPTNLHFDRNAYSDPEKFDGYRYVKMADDPQKEKFRHFVSTSPEHMGFGHGKHACPGRFFAANEIKVALCHILMKYDFKLAEGSKPTVLKMGWVLSSDPMAQLMVRRREGVDEDLLHR